jgi:hypothetical protein
MIEFWDIDFDDELDLEVEDFVEGLLKLGFKRKNNVGKHFVSGLIIQ